LLGVFRAFGVDFNPPLGIAVAVLEKMPLKFNIRQRITPMFFKIYIEGGQYRWTLYASNYKKIANSGEAYHNKTDCLHAIGLVMSTNSNTPVTE
jgi:uncharacterized protein YegP (UPF0339 family)